MKCIYICRSMSSCPPALRLFLTSAVREVELCERRGQACEAGVGDGGTATQTETLQIAQA